MTGVVDISATLDVDTTAKERVLNKRHGHDFGGGNSSNILSLMCFYKCKLLFQSSYITQTRPIKHHFLTSYHMNKPHFALDIETDSQDVGE